MFKACFNLAPASSPLTLQQRPGNGAIQCCGLFCYLTISFFRHMASSGSPASQSPFLPSALHHYRHIWWHLTFPRLLVCPAVRVHVDLRDKRRNHFGCLFSYSASLVLQPSLHMFTPVPGERRLGLGLPMEILFLYGPVAQNLSKRTTGKKMWGDSVLRNS